MPSTRHDVHSALRSTVLLLPVLLLFWQIPILAQQNLFNHLYWRAKGQRPNQDEGYVGLNYLGRLNDTVRNAVAIGEVTGSWSSEPRRNISALCFNNGVQDTARHFEFPGEKVIRANINGDAYPDYVVWSETSRRLTVLFGTPSIDSFVTGRIIQERGRFDFDLTGMAVADCNNDGYDDLITSDIFYQDSLGREVGRNLFYRGGPIFDSLPADSMIGTPNDIIGGRMIVAHVRDQKQLYLCEHRNFPNNAEGKYFHKRIFLYPVSSDFRLRPVDTIYCTYDSVANGQLVYSGFSFDVDGDSIDDIIMAASGRVLVYKGGPHIDSLPTYYFTTPFPGSTTTLFGTHIIDIGDISGHGYHSMLVTDPEASGLVGAVYLYNLGRARKDSCVAYAFGQQTFLGYFGTQAIAIGDVNYDGLADFMVSAQEDTVEGGGGEYAGAVFVFLGNASYGPTVEVAESASNPSSVFLRQNYPNPCSASTDIQFSVDEESQHGRTTEMKLFDVLGREVRTLFQSEAPQGNYALHVLCEDLPNGTYTYRLLSGAGDITRRLNVMH
jgi:hypothetical protein